ncbi:MAG: sulfite exporter TauE/SafE family protein [Candidatus Cloacimonas sp.]
MIFHSAFEYSYIWLPLIGFIIGFFASMVGGGGGFFFLPALILFFKVPAQIAVATSLAATLPVCIVGSFGHYRNGNIDVRMGLVFALAGIIGALSGASLTSLMTSKQLKTSFGIYSILIAFQMIINNWKKKKAEANGIKIPDVSNLQKVTKGTFYGFLAGVITGTFGTSGTAPVLAGLFAMRMPIKLVVGTSLMVVCVNTLFALGAHFIVGKIDLTLIYFLTAGTVIGAFSGPKLLAGIKIDRAEGPIQQWYALGMIVFGILMIIS